MSGYANQILGGNGDLIKDQIISPNYVAGSAGWRIGRDGTVEFNNGKFRGAVLIGGPPAAGAASLGLVGTDIPAVLRNFSADYTWNVADIYWIDGAQFFFSALVHNTAFAVVERLTGIYTTAGGVQLQTFVPATSPNTSQHGSSFYDTKRLQEQWRFADVSIDNTCTLTVDAVTNKGLNPVKTQSPQNNNTVFFTDPELLITFGTGGNYPFRMVFWYQSTAAQGLKFRFNAGGIVGTDWRAQYSTSLSNAQILNNATVTVAAPDALLHPITIDGIFDINTPPVTMNFQWAQNVAGASATLIGYDSYWHCWRCA